MFNVVAKKYGDPDILIYEESNSLQLNANSVRVQVKSIGVNFADILIILDLPFRQDLKLQELFQK